MNSVAYFEIQADEPEKAVQFYAGVFGWKFIKDETVPIPYYRISEAGPSGGLLKRPSPRPAQEQGTNAFVCSVHVKKFDATAEKILQHGGQVALPKFAVKGKCWQGYFLDPEGNTFGLFEVDEKAA
jgi:predicted enzyme related to lactoylglutathione lyase